MKYLMDTDEWTVTIVDNVNTLIEYCEWTYTANSRQNPIMKTFYCDSYYIKCRIKEESIFHIRNKKLNTQFCVLFSNKGEFPQTVNGIVMNFTPLMYYAVPIMCIYNFFNGSYDTIDDVLYHYRQIKRDEVSGDYVDINGNDRYFLRS